MPGPLRLRPKPTKCGHWCPRDSSPDWRDKTYVARRTNRPKTCRTSSGTPNRPAARSKEREAIQATAVTSWSSIGRGKEHAKKELSCKCRRRRRRMRVSTSDMSEERGATPFTSRARRAIEFGGSSQMMSALRGKRLEGGDGPKRRHTEGG